jgi:hypothetical protein
LKQLFALLFISFCVTGLNAQETVATQTANSVVTATLHHASKTIDGFVETQYINNSTDTLHFIWFRLVPNAFKNDRTAFSEYLLSKGRTDFYFSKEEDRGYINRLDFRADGEVLNVEDHPKYIDLIKVILNKPLLPGAQTTISTPFHVKVPHRFKWFGYADENYFLKDWYPAPAQYWSGKWRDEPFLDTDIDWSEFGLVSITLSLPRNFTVESREKASKISENDSMTVFRFSNGSTNYLTIETDKYVDKDPSLSSSYVRDLLCKKWKRLISHRLLPAIGYNEYDGLQLGILAQNIQDESANLTYAVAPLFAFNSKRITGLADVQYRATNKIDVGINAATFSTFKGTDSLQKKIFGNVYKVAPYVRLNIPSSNKNIEKSLEYRLFLIGERQISYSQNTVDDLYYPAKGKLDTRYLNQLTFNYSSNRTLYPYHASLQLQQGEYFYRVNATGHYFFNYANGGGLRMRIFASKFDYIGDLTSSQKFATVRYQPKLTAVRGDEDYTYSNYFVARNNFSSFDNQVMMRDGGLKLRTDMFEGLQGRSDDWIASMNLNTTLPQITPIKIPLRIFMDVGTYSEAWDRNYEYPRFLYVAGLQLALFHDVVNIYAPLLYSDFFRDQMKTVPEENKFWKRISFSMDVQHLNFRKPFCSDRMAW